MGAREPQEQPLKSESVGAWLALLFGLAAILRFIRLGFADLWVDEMLFVWRSAPPLTWGAMLRNTWSGFAVVSHMPLPELVENAFLWLLRPSVPNPYQSPLILRIPAALWGTAATIMTYLLARRVLTERGAKMAGLLAACLLYPVYYSREAYYYAPLMFFSAASMLGLAEFLEGRPSRTGAWWMWGVALLGLVFSHITGTMLLVVMLVVLVGARLGRRFFSQPGESAPDSAPATPFVLMTFALATVVPFYIRLAQNKGSLPITRSGLSFVQILHDAATQMAFGSTAMWALLTWALVIGGVVYLLVQSRKRLAAGAVALVWTVSWLLLAWFAYRSQYFSRYFAALSPLQCVVMAAGWDWAVGWLPQRMPRGGAKVYVAATVLLLVAHGVWGLLPLYQVRAKYTDFRGLAEWLVKNMRPGRPYMYQYGGWDFRFMPGFYPTPGLTPVVSIAWNGPDFSPALLALQTQIATRFPESAYIESVDAEPEGQQRAEKIRPFYRRKAELFNEPARLLLRRGLWPPGAQLGERIVHYNASEDLPAIARERGEVILPDFGEWRCQAVGQEVYAWVREGALATLPIENLAGIPLRGKIRMEAALLSAGGEHTLTVYLKNQNLGQKRVPGGKLFTLEYEDVTLDTDRPALMLSAAPSLAGSVQAYAVFSVTFTPAPERIENAE